MHGALSSVRLLHSTSLAHSLQRLPGFAHRAFVTLPARVKRASPASQAGNPRGIRVSGAPARKRPIDADFRDTLPGMPLGRRLRHHFI